MSTTDAPNPSDVQNPEKQPLTLDVKVDSPQTCLRHVVVSVSRADVNRYFKDAYDELTPEANVPGFRSGRAPRKLVEKKFKEHVASQVKGSLLMDSLEQVTAEQSFSAISEPELDFSSVVLPDDGDFKFEFDVEVRPEFETPNWKGLKLEAPESTVSDREVDAALTRVLKRLGSTEAVDEPAKLGDFLLLTAEFHDGDTMLAEMDEERIELTAGLGFRDGVCEGFGKLLEGAKEGDSRTGKVTVSKEADSDLAGKEIDVTFTVVEVGRRKTPKMTDALLKELGDFESETELRSFISSSLERQAGYHRDQSLRKQIVAELTKDAGWDLPSSLVRRQSQRELQRQILEMRRAGFDDEMIKRLASVLRQNALTSTEASLREHFILEKIAEDESMEASPMDYESEIELIADQSDMPVRRVRARLEKSGQMDALRNQIIERKVIELVVSKATVKSIPSDDSDVQAATQNAAVDFSVLDTRESLPDAKYDNETPDPNSPTNSPANKTK